MWGRIAQDAGWIIDDWSAHTLTIGDVLSWGRSSVKERQEAEKKRKKGKR